MVSGWLLQLPHVPVSAAAAAAAAAAALPLPPVLLPQVRKRLIFNLLLCSHTESC